MATLTGCCFYYHVRYLSNSWLCSLLQYTAIIESSAEREPCSWKSLVASRWLRVCRSSAARPLWHSARYLNCRAYCLVWGPAESTAGSASSSRADSSRTMSMRSGLCSASRWISRSHTPICRYWWAVPVTFQNKYNYAMAIVSKHVLAISARNRKTSPKLTFLFNVNFPNMYCMNTHVVWLLLYDYLGLLITNLQWLSSGSKSTHLDSWRTAALHRKARERGASRFLFGARLQIEVFVAHIPHSFYQPVLAESVRRVARAVHCRHMWKAMWRTYEHINAIMP